MLAGILRSVTPPCSTSSIFPSTLSYILLFLLVTGYPLFFQGQQQTVPGFTSLRHPLFLTCSTFLKGITRLGYTHSGKTPL